jgi:hypothetical protein
MINVGSTVRASMFFGALFAAFLQVCAASAAFERGTYKLPAGIDPTVSTEMATELWAEVWRPNAAGPFPLIVFLHGNHGTCGRFSGGIRIDDRSDYTFSGTCPGGYVVTPNHLGYNYLARNLANNGYLVVSINANRGVNAAPGVFGDSGLNLRRGRLVLRHLQQLAQWNASGGAPPSLGFQLTGLIDFSHVGLMGHSRGGEGMRAAVAQYKDPGSPWPARIGPVTFEALFEIGPVDGQTSRILNAVHLDWNVLLPGCDGDVSNLQGIKPFDRMLQIDDEPQPQRKSSFLVYGANHNFFNTEWQLSDASSCLGQSPLFPSTGGSASQRAEALQTVMPFFRAHVGPTPIGKQARRFDPSYQLPEGLTEITRHARGFTWTPKADRNFIIDDFDNNTGTSSRNVPNQASGLSEYTHGQASTNHDASQRAAAVSWNSLGDFLQVNAAGAGSSVNVSSLRTLEFRVLLRCSGSVCSSAPNPTGDVDFSIALVDRDGILSDPVTLKSVAVVSRPAGESSLNFLFQTVRIPLSDFAGVDLGLFRGVRFIFDQTPSSSISLGNVRLTRAAAGPGGVPPEPPPVEQIASGDARAAVMMANASAPDDNRILSIRRLDAATAARTAGLAASAVEIEVTSSRPFPIGGALPTLVIGDQQFTLSRFRSGKTDRLIFTIPAAEFGSVRTGAPVSVVVGGAPVWRFGPLQR